MWDVTAAAGCMQGLGKLFDKPSAGEDVEQTKETNIACVTKAT